MWNKTEFEGPQLYFKENLQYTWKDEQWESKKCVVRSNRLQMFFKIDNLKNFAKFTGKDLLQSISQWIL